MAGKEGVIEKAGTATSGIPPFAQTSTEVVDDAVKKDGAGDAGATGDDKPSGDAGAGAAAAADDKSGGQAELTDDQLKTLLKNKGIDFEGDFEALKAKLTQPAASTELTDEQKAEKEKVLEKRMLDAHISSGGTAEQFVALKQIAAMDLKTLSEATIKNEMKAGGFSDDEIASIIKERYYQMNPDELQKIKTWDEKEEKMVEESDEDFQKRKDLLTKKVAAFSKKFVNRSLHIKQNAEQSLKDLRDAIAAEDDANRKEAEFSSKVDEISKSLSRKLTFELGEIDKKKIDPVLYDVTDAQIAEVANELKDPAKRKQLFFNSDGTLDVSKVFNLLLRHKSLESAVKTSFIEGGNRQVEELKKVFPGSPHQLGVGGQQRKTNQAAGKIASAGKPVVVPNNV